MKVDEDWVLNSNARSRRFDWHTSGRVETSESLGPIDLFGAPFLNGRPGYGTSDNTSSMQCEVTVRVLARLDLYASATPRSNCTNLHGRAYPGEGAPA